MSIKVTSTNIEIQNSAGVKKFSATDSLLSYSRMYTATIDVTTDMLSVAFPALAQNEVLVLQITINSCSGNVGADLVGYSIPGNCSILLNFDGYLTGSTPAAVSDYLSVALINNILGFSITRVHNNKLIDISPITANITYEAYVYQYL